MTSITDLCRTIESAKATGGDITIKADDLAGLLRLASIMGDSLPAISSLATSFKEVTSKLKISRQTLYRWRREGRFTPKPINQRGTKWMRRDFIRWMQAQQV
jgi:predicted DNA-binding transcriptional regulator AlpA